MSWCLECPEEAHSSTGNDETDGGLMIILNVNYTQLKGFRKT